MNKKHIITLSGDLASGKGIVSKILEERLNYQIYRNGEYFRKLAKQKNMSIIEFNLYVENHPEIDQEIEKSAEKYAKDHDNLIIDARLGWYVVPKSFKVYLTVDLDVSATRAFNDLNRASTEKYVSIEEAKEKIKQRATSERKRYLEIYGVDKTDMKNYDYVIDTTNATPERVADNIIKEYEKWLSK